MKKIILIVGGLVTLILSILWYKDIITEPLVAIVSGIITLLTLIFVPENEQYSNKTKVKQKHSGKGDNVAGNKTVKK